MRPVFNEVKADIDADIYYPLELREVWNRMNEIMQQATGYTFDREFPVWIISTEIQNRLERDENGR